jgi:hypothetical protein
MCLKTVLRSISASDINADPDQDPAFDLDSDPGFANTPKVEF